jgi:hypothetical protein
MSRLTLAGAACAVWLAASPAAAEPFETFVEMCLDTSLDRQVVDARAKAAGWVALPAAEGDLPEDIRDPAMYSSVDLRSVGDKGMPHDLEFLMTGWGTGETVFGIAGVRTDLCMVLSPASDPAALEARLQELFGFAPVEAEGAPAWLFSRAGSTFRPELALIDMPDDEALRIATERKVYIAGILPQDDMFTLMLATIRPSE